MHIAQRGRSRNDDRPNNNTLPHPPISGGTAETQSSNQDQVDSVSVMVRMNNTVNILKEGSNDVLTVVGKVAKDILEPYSETNDRELRQKYGDHLSEIDAPLYLTNLLRRLMDTGLETRDGWLGMYVVRSVFWNYSDASLKMAKGLGRSGLLKIVLNDLDTYGIKSSKNEASEILHELGACIYFIKIQLVD